MSLFSKTEQITSTCAVHLEAVRRLCDFHSLRSGSPTDFLQLASKLVTSEGFRLDLSDLARTIRDRERGRLGAEDVLTMLGLAIGGPGIAGAAVELREAAATVQVLLAGVGGWREVDAASEESWGEIGGSLMEVADAPAGGVADAEQYGAGVERSGSESSRIETSQAGPGQANAGIRGSRVGRDRERLGVWDGEEPEVGRGWGERAGSGGEVSPEMRETLERLELANMQMKVYLDDIDRRMGRIQPHLEGLTGRAQAPAEHFPRSVRDGRQDGGEAKAGWDGSPKGEVVAESKVIAPEVAAEPIGIVQNWAPEPMVTARRSGAKSKVIWYEAPRGERAVRCETATPAAAGQEVVSAQGTAEHELDGGPTIRGAGAKPGQWAWGATVAAVLVAATVVTLYRPWRLAGGEPSKAGAEVSGTAANRLRAESTGVPAEDIGADAALVTLDRASRSGTSGSVTGIGPGAESESTGGSKGRGVGAASARAAAPGRIRPESTDQGSGIATVRPGIENRGVTGTIHMQGSGSGPPVTSEPATSPAKTGAFATVPAGTTDALKNAAVGAQGEVGKNRVEGARAEDPARGTRVENLHPDDSGTRPATVGGGMLARVETSASSPATLASSNAPAGAKATPSVSAESPSTGTPGGGRDVPRASVGRPELTAATIGGTVISAPSPIYPQQTRQMRVEGNVTVRALVDKTGAVKGLQVVDGPGLLRQSAEEAVKRRRYKPLMLHGEAVEFQTMVTLNYKLAR